MPIGTTAFPTSLDTASLLIEATNNAATTLSAQLTAGATTATVVSTTLFPSTGVIVIENERISYTGKTGATFTGLSRGFGGTTDATHASTTDVELLIVAEMHNVLSAAIIAIETKLGTGSTIAVNKLAALTATIVPITDASGFLSSSAVTPTELGYLTGVTSAIQTQFTNKQGLDATLTALAAYNTNGLLTQTAADTFTGRTLTGTADRITITNGNGGSGNPTADIASTYVGQATITTLGTITTGVWNGTAIGASYIAALTSAQLAGIVSDETGSGSLVFATTPTLVTPVLGVATATSVNKVAITAPATSATLTIADGATLTASASATVSGTNTGDQTITLTGNVTGSGTGSLATTIANTAVTNAMLAGSIAYSKLSLTGEILNADLAGSIAITKITMNTARLLGRTTASSGAVEEISLGYGLAMASTTLRTAVPSVVVLTDGATVSVDATLRGPYRLTLGGNRTLANPTGAVDGQIMTFELIQDATGSRTLSLDSAYALGTDITAVTLTTAASKRDFLTVQYNSGSAKFAVIAFTKGY